MESNVSRHAGPVRGALLALLLALAPGSADPVAAAPAGASSTTARATPADPAPPPVPAAPPRDPADVAGWLAWREAQDLPALPHAAAILYRLGNEAKARGDAEAAVRLWRGAEELDPHYLAPRVTLAGHLLGTDVAQGLMEVGRIVALARTQFRLQHFFVTFGLFHALSALYLATTAVALLLCWRHRHRLRHVYAELLRRRLPGRRATVWAWVAVLLPWGFGLGVAVPATFTLALLWHYLKRGERAVFIGLTALLAVSPLATRAFDELAMPARRTAPPFYSTLRVDQEPFQEARLAELAALARSHPDNPFLAFSEGWMAERGKRFDQAVDAYQRAQALWPNEARIPNNLGNIETWRGDAEAAEAQYKRAIELAPRWAAPRYNLGQLYTARYRYAEASEEMAQATALDFDLVRSLQARASSGSQPALAEEWLEPSVQWPALFAPATAAAVVPSPPPAWRPWVESRGLPVALWALAFAALGLGLGFMLHHHLPARTCGNCSATVCRRCATRRRDQVLCVECAGLVANASTPEFGRLLLFKRRRETRKRRGQIRLAISTLVPGYGALAFDRVVLGWTLTTAAVLFAFLALGGLTPFPYDPRVQTGAGPAGATAALVGLVVAHAISILVAVNGQARERESDAGVESTSARPAARLKRAA